MIKKDVKKKMTMKKRHSTRRVFSQLLTQSSVVVLSVHQSKVLYQKNVYNGGLDLFV